MVRIRTGCCVAFALIFLNGCSTNFVPRTKLIERQFSGKDSRAERRISIRGFRNKGGECLREAVKSYLEGTKGFRIIDDELKANGTAAAGSDNKIDFILTGEMQKFGAGSNIDERNAAIAYFTAFIITSPIAIGIANTDWEGYAIASANISVLDAGSSKEIWAKQHSIMVEEKDDAMIAQDRAHLIFLDIACRNLSTEMMNEFMQAYTKLQTTHKVGP